MRRTPSSADTQALVLAALLVAVGAVLGLAESSMLPPLPVAGVRLGLANLATVLAMSWIGPVRALRVSVVRVLLVATAAGTIGGPAFLMALTGAVAAWAVMAVIARHLHGTTVVGWSVAGAAAHTAAQLLAASVLTGTSAPLLLAPVSLALSLPCGLAMGSAARLLLSRVPVVSLEVGKG